MSYFITAQAAIRYYFLAIQSGDREVGGYAKFHVDENNNCIITELRPLKQESCEVYFEIGAKENALFLEKLVGEGEDPKDWGMLFHTHPSGMSADMSGTDVTMLTEMANDLPGQVARSMILPQGKLHPMIHEAVQIEGRVFMRRSSEIKILDTTNALADLKEIGFFDVPKQPVGFQGTPGAWRPTGAPAQRSGYTQHYGQGQSAAQRTVAQSGGNRELVPLQRPGSSFHGRAYSANDGWYDEQPGASEVTDPTDTAEYSSWLDDAWADRADALKEEEELTALDQQDKHDALMWDAAEDYIGETCIYNGHPVSIIDAYVSSTGNDDDEIVLVFPDNKEVTLAEVTMPTKLEAVKNEAQSA